MSLIPVSTSDNAGGATASGNVTQVHGVVTAIGGELIGVIVLAIFADLNSELGGWMVALMSAWFLVFLMINAPALKTLVSKV